MNGKCLQSPGHRGQCNSQSSGSLPLSLWGCLAVLAVASPRMLWSLRALTAGIKPGDQR